MCVVLLFFLSILAANVGVDGQCLYSPCPDMFVYVNDGPMLQGLVRIDPFGPVDQLIIKMSFTVDTRYAMNWYGTIPNEGDAMRMLEYLNRGIPLTHKIMFPPMPSVPHLTGIMVNGDVLCYEDPRDACQPNYYVTTVTLESTLNYRPAGMFGPRYDVTRYLGPQSNMYNQLQNRMNTNYPVPYPVLKLPTLPPVKDYPKSNETEIISKNYYPTDVSSTVPPTSTETPKEERKPWWSVTNESYHAFESDCGVDGVDPVPLIYGGTTYQRGKWPWLVALFLRDKSGLRYICEGTLVSNRHVITAAHCMQRKKKRTDWENILVRLGVYNLDDWNDEHVLIRDVENATVPESYNSTTFANDILILTLDRPVQFSLYIRAACLWSGNTEQNTIVDNMGVVAGWGANEDGTGGTGVPRMVEMPIVSTLTCRGSRVEFHSLTSSNTICAGFRNGSSPCLGDSGGGLYLYDDTTKRWRLRGIVSVALRLQNTTQGCNRYEYIVFTDAAQYLPWIKNTMSP